MRNDFETLYSQNFPWAVRYAYGILQNHHDAEDAAQNAFIRVQAVFGRWDKKTPFQAWLRTFVRNEAYLVIRRRSYKIKPTLSATESEIEALGRIPDNSPAVEDILIIEEQIQHLESLLFEIPNPKIRMVWVLKEYEGYTTKEIAEILKMNKDSVRVYHSRCNAILKGKKTCRN